MSLSPSAQIRNHWLQLLGIAAVLAALDQLAKGGVRSLLSPGARLPVLDGILQVRYVQNYRGLSWWLPDLPGWFGPVLDILFLLIVLGVIPVYLFYAGKKRTSGWARISAICLTAGALGHLSDGLFAPYTVDFIQFFNWPSANFADFYSYLGLGALILECVWLARKGGHHWKGMRPFLATMAQTRREFLQFLIENLRINQQD